MVSYMQHGLILLIVALQIEPLDPQDARSQFYPRDQSDKRATLSWGNGGATHTPH